MTRSDKVVWVACFVAWPMAVGVAVLRWLDHHR